MENLSAYQSILKKMNAAADKNGRSEPELVAVSKFQSFEKIVELYQQGQRVFGENYVQELLEKKNQANEAGLSDLEFHFIGHLQTNKVKVLLPAVSTIHSVDTLKLYLEIEKRARELQKRVKVYLQVNIDEEESKGGFRDHELAALIQALPQSEWVERKGLMAIPDPDLKATESFQKMKKISDEFSSSLGAGLSLGMSQDFELAIAFGSTSVRIGSALFGPRIT